MSIHDEVLETPIYVNDCLRRVAIACYTLNRLL